MTNYKETISQLFKQTDFPYNQKNCVHDLLSNKKIILYGGGDGFITFSVFVLRKYGLKTSAILDRKFKFSDSFYGTPAFSPLVYQPTSEEKDNAVVVITVGKKKYHQEILNSLHGLGFKKVILASDIYEYHLLHPSTELEKKGFSYYLDNKEKIMASLDLFRDDLSKEIFSKFMQTHMQKKVIKIPARPLKEQYFPKDVELKRGYSRFINCGAYDGDTVKQLNGLHGKVKAIVCFEPDPKNFNLLTQYLSNKHKEIAKTVIALPCGVFSDETQLRFSSGDKINSMISNTGDSFIQCVALDHVIPGFKPTFITMDVEGVELEALKGAEILINDNKPDLAISVYHAPNHIWDIPLYIDRLNLGYKFYLRNYTSFISETMLYATR